MKNWTYTARKSLSRSYNELAQEPLPIPGLLPVDPKVFEGVDISTMPLSFNNLSALGKTCYLYFHAKAPKRPLLKAILESDGGIVRDIELEEPRESDDETFFARMIAESCRVNATAQYMHGVVSALQCGQYTPSVAGIFKQRVILDDPESKGYCADCVFYRIGSKCSLRLGASPEIDDLSTDQNNYSSMNGVEFDDEDHFTFDFGESPGDHARLSMSREIGNTPISPSIKQTPSSQRHSILDDILTQPLTYATIVQNILNTAQSRLTAIDSALKHINNNNISIILMKQQLAFVTSNSATIDDLLQELQSTNDHARDLKRWKDIAFMNKVALRATGEMKTAADEVNDRFLDGWLGLVVKDWQSMDEILNNLLE